MASLVQMLCFLAVSWWLAVGAKTLHFIQSSPPPSPATHTPPSDVTAAMTTITVTIADKLQQHSHDHGHHHGWYHHHRHQYNYNIAAVPAARHCRPAPPPSPPLLSPVPPRVPPPLPLLLSPPLPTPPPPPRSPGGSWGLWCLTVRGLNSRSATASCSCVLLSPDSEGCDEVHTS